MRGMLGIAGFIARALLFTVLVHEAAEALDGGSLTAPEVFPDDEPALSGSPSSEPAATGPLPEPEPFPEPEPLPHPLPAPAPAPGGGGLPAVGRTAGHASVTPTGEAAYVVPLTLPAGTRGMTPALSLEYRHRTGGSWIGAGWSVGGLSVITRCPRTLVQDGQAGPVQLSRSDRFCLDGRRLVVVDGRDYGSEGAEYRTEIESFARIRSHGVAGYGPQHFVVEWADGRIAEYGVTADSRVDRAGRSPTPWAWALNRLRDRSGNVIDYRYVEDAAQASFRLASIAYNGNPSAGLAATHQVSFVYETRPANEVDLGYVAGQPVRQVTRLTRVDVSHAGSLVKRYELDFEPSLSTAGRSRLAAIRECGREGSACLAPTVLQWQDGTPGLGAERALSWSLGGAAWLEEGKRWWVADVNGDGRDDLVWSGGSTPTLRYRLAQATGVLGAEVNTGIAAPQGAGVPLDYDGDGIGDVLMVSAAARWQIVRGGPAGLGAAIDTGIAASAIDYRGADLDGNGLPDLAYSENVGGYGNGLVVRVRYNQPGAGFSRSPVTLYEQGIHAGYTWAEGGNFLGRPGRKIDLDGDGREDLLMNEEHSIARISADQRMSEAFDSSFAGGVPADINGDGCTDFAYPHYQGQWRVRFSGCQVAGPYGAEIAGPGYAVVRYSALALDWNGDGKDDLLYADNGSTWKVVRSTGESLAPVLDSGLVHGSPTTTAVGDLNGDGLDDLVARTGTRVAYRLHPGVAPDLLLAVRDGFGVQARFRYAPLTRAGVHVREGGATYPQQDLQDARQVVTALALSDGTGTGALAETGYQYRGLRRELSGRGDLGFRVRIATPVASTALVVEDTYRQDYPYVGLGVREVAKRKDGAVVRNTGEVWSKFVLGSGSAARQRPYLASRSEKLYEPGVSSASRLVRTTTWSVAAIDKTSGVVTDRSLTVTEGSGGPSPGAQRTERLRVPSLLNDTTNWCLGRPRTRRLSAYHGLQGGAELAREEVIQWDGVACRAVSATVLPADPTLQVQVAIEHDRFGNPSRSTVTGAGMAARVSTIDWGARGRFPIRVAGSLGTGWSATWDEADGALSSWTDANGLSTRLEHDDFGRPVAQLLPDGRRTTWSLQSCDAGCDPRAVYRITARDLDSLGAIAAERLAEFDGFERAVRRAWPMPGGAWAGETVEFDEKGRTLRVDRPAWTYGSSTGYWKHEYDELDRLVATRLHAADGTIERSLQFAHDGLTVRMTDAQGREATRDFTAWGDTRAIHQPAGAALRFEHDAFGRLLRVEDETGRSLGELAYNAAGMKTSHRDADLGQWSFTWNALGELISQRDAKAQTTSFGYDLLGRLVRRVEKEGTTTWTWGASVASRNVGRLLSVSGPGYSESYAYDAYSRPATRTIKSDATYQYAFGWDSAGQLASLTYPASAAGFRLRLGYDYEAGALVRIRDLSAQGRPLWQLTATDPAGNVLDLSLGSVGRVVAGYSPVTGGMEYQELLSSRGEVLQDVTYRWDGAGNLLERHDQRHGVVERFSYDQADRLLAVTRNGQADLGLRYDAAGNITWKSDLCPGLADCFGYDPERRHAVVAAGAGRYGYDANGNMTVREGATINWYSFNQPKTIAAGGNTATFWYGPARNRWKQVAVEGGISETTIYVGGLLEKVTRSGKTSWRHYVQAPNGTAAVHLRHADGSAPQTRFLAHDHLGGTSAILDGASGSVLLQQGYDAFGRRRAAGARSGPSAADWAVIRAVTRDGFTGHEHLDNVGLVHMNGRVHDPAIGRFLSPDPVVQAPFDRQDLNRYAYAWNNPLNVIDPSGLEEVACLHGRHGRCQGVTVTGLRQWPSTLPGYMALRSGSNGQVVSAAQRDPCGQDGSAEACARSASPASAAGAGVPAAIGPGAGDYWRGLAASLGNLAMNSAPVFWLFGDDPDYEWFPVPNSAAGQDGARLGNVGYLVGGVSGSIRRIGTKTVAAVHAPGLTVLGHYPGYVETAERLGARYFNIPKGAWARLSPEEQWAANARFLDRVIARGDTVILSTPATRARAGSAYSRELGYLSRHGYELVEDGTRMVPGVQR
jgi:RHS repeat-associated protein